MIKEPIHVEQPRLLAGEEGRAAGSYHILGRWRSLKLIIAAAVLLVALLALISGLIQKGLWMRQLGYSGVFWTLLSLRWELFCVAFVVALLYLWINLRLAARNTATFRADHLTSESAVAATLGIQIFPTVLKLATAAVAGVAALVLALIFYAQWRSEERRVAEECGSR